METPKEVSVKVAINRAGYDSIQDVQREALFGSRIGVPSTCDDGCIVEPDGKCPHGYPSVLRKKLLI